MMRIMIACEIANKSENMENQKHRVFWENIVFFQVPAISWVLGSSGMSWICLSQVEDLKHLFSEISGSDVLEVGIDE